jgi:transcription attenuation protein (tryptophan RNA-binding attenuator protein)
VSSEHDEHDGGDVGGRYILIKALEDGVTIIGLTRGRDTRFSHTEKLDRGEVMVAQFTEVTAAIKIRGRAEVHTEVGTVTSGSPDATGAGFVRAEKS